MRTAVRSLVVLLLAAVLTACLTSEDSCACSMPDDSPTLEIYLLTSWEPGAELVPFEFQDDTGRDPGLVAVTALLHHTPPADAELVNGWAPFEEPIADVLSVTHEDGRIVVNLDRDMYDPFPTTTLTITPDGRLTYQQLVRTVQQAYGTDDPVRLDAEGEDARGVWGYAVD